MITRRKKIKVFCQYCTTEAVLIDSRKIHGYNYGKIYYCNTCGAYVGCHKKTKKPLGTLANEELRKYRMSLHRLFDKKWNDYMIKSGCSKKRARSFAYMWLSQRMEINKKECHIGMFDVDRCKLAIKVCKNLI